LSLLKRMLDHMGFSRARQESGRRALGSNRGYAPERLISHLIISAWCGANRFERAEVTRHDPVIGKLFDFARMAHFKAVMRLFARSTPEQNEAIFDHLYRWRCYSLVLNNITLYLDLTYAVLWSVGQKIARPLARFQTRPHEMFSLAQPQH
jgi:hypothetical protein